MKSTVDLPLFASRYWAPTEVPFRKIRLPKICANDGSWQGRIELHNCPTQGRLFSFANRREASIFMLRASSLDIAETASLNHLVVFIDHFVRRTFHHPAREGAQLALLEVREWFLVAHATHQLFRCF